MLNNKKAVLAIKIASCTFLLGSIITIVPTLSSCDNPTDNETVIGSYDGTDWQGYISGRLRCTLDEYGTSARIENDWENYDTEEEWLAADNYKAHNLVIPDLIRYPNGKTVPLKTIYCMFDNSDNLSGTLTLGKNLVQIAYSFNDLGNVVGDLELTNNLYDVYESFSGCGFDKVLTIGDMLEYLEYCFERNNFNDVAVSKYNYSFGLATNVGEKCHVLVEKNEEKGTCLFDWANSNSMISNLAFGELTIPDDVEWIGYEVFRNCSKLKGDLIIPETVKSINSNAFNNSGFDGKLKIGSKLENIGWYVFKNCNFSSLEISNENLNYGLATNVGPNCDALVAKTGDNDFLVDYSDSDSIISGLAFGNLLIPDGTSELSGELIENCHLLTGISFEAESTLPYKLVQSRDGEGVFVESISSDNPGFMLDLQDVPGEAGVDMAISSKVPFAIGDLTIPDTILGHNVVAIGDNPYQDGDAAFSTLKITKLTTGANLTTLYGSAFRNCQLTEINLTNVTTIYESAFEGDTITKVSMPKITSLSDEAFEFQSHITSITIDASVNPTSLNITEDHEDVDILDLSRNNEGKLIDISGNGTYKNEWKAKLKLANSWVWEN